MVAFEPAEAERNTAYIRRLLALNRATNVKVLSTSRTSLGSRDSIRDLTIMSPLDPSGGLELQSTVIDDLVAWEEAPSPNVVKLDMEGGELAVLGGATKVLRDARTTIFLSHTGGCSSGMRFDPSAIRVRGERDRKGAYQLADDLVAQPIP